MGSRLGSIFSLYCIGEIVLPNFLRQESGQATRQDRQETDQREAIRAACRWQWSLPHDPEARRCLLDTTPATKLRREYTIGKVDDWSLADARDEAAKLRLAIKREGADPVQERQKVNQNPFKTLNDLYADYYELRKREIASHQKEKSLYEREVAWRIGKVELYKIRPVDISEILRVVANG